MMQNPTTHPFHVGTSVLLALIYLLVVEVQVQVKLGQPYLWLTVAQPSIFFLAKWESSSRVGSKCLVDRTPSPSTSVLCPTAARASTALKMKKQVAAVQLSFKVRVVVEKSRPAVVEGLRKKYLANQIIARALHFWRCTKTDYKVRKAKYLTPIQYLFLALFSQVTRKEMRSNQKGERKVLMLTGFLQRGRSLKGQDKT